MVNRTFQDLADNQLGGRDGTGMSLLVEIVSDNPCLRYLNISGELDSRDTCGLRCF